MAGVSATSKPKGNGGFRTRPQRQTLERTDSRSAVSMIISFDRRFIFVHIAKTAGDSVTYALSPYAGKNSVVVHNDFQARRDRLRRRRYRNLYQLPKHSPATEIRSILGEMDSWDGFFKFSFVRDPIARAMSLYTYLAAKSRERERLMPRNLWYGILAEREHDPAHWPAMRAYRETENFSQFIRHPSALADQAMCSQASLLHDSDGALIVDFVGRFESLSTDFAHVAKTIGLKEVELPILNASAPRVPGAEITRGDRHYLRDLYAGDFHYFGYALHD